MNTRMLKEIADWIIKKPEKFDIGSWAGTRMVEKGGKEICGTTCCIAGEAVHMAGAKITRYKSDWESTGWGANFRMTPEFRETAKCIAPEDSDIIDRYQDGQILDTEIFGQILLGLDMEQADHLFFAERWPEEFAERYRAASNLHEEAQVAYDRIMHLIETGE